MGKSIYEIRNSISRQRTRGVFTAKREIPTIVYKLENENISVDGAPANLLGEILLNMQRLVFSVGQHFYHDASPLGRHSQEIKDLYSLNVSLKSGCLAVHFTPKFPAEVLIGQKEFPEQETLQENTFKKTSELFDCLESEEIDYEEAKKKVYEIIDDPRCRVNVFNPLMKLTPPEHIKGSIGFLNCHFGEKKTNIGKRVFKTRVKRILKENFREGEREVNGVIVRIKDDAPGQVFKIKTIDNRLVTVQLPEEYRQKVIQFIMDRTPIKLLGIGIKRKQLEIDEIDRLEPNTETQITEAGGFRLTKPLSATVSYEKYDNETDFWVVTNEELGVNGVDVKLENAKKMFSDDLYEDYKVYKGIPDEKLNEKAKELKRKLEAFFEK